MSKGAEPLNPLTSSKKPFQWTPEADHAVQQLKAFIQAPILSKPDPTQQLIPGVDTSDSAVDTLLSQRSPHHHKIHPCAFFSKKFSTAEKNYDIGDRELLGIKLTLEECWRSVWTEPVIPPVRQEIKPKTIPLVPLLFTFQPKHLLPSRIQKKRNLTAFSRIHQTDDGPTEEVTILSPSCFIGSLTWYIERSIKNAQQSVSDPGRGPPGRCTHSIFHPSTDHPLGSFLHVFLPSQNQSSHCSPAKIFLVAIPQQICCLVHFGLSYLHSKQIISPTSRWSSATPLNTNLSLVSHCSGLHHYSLHIQR